jgi:hypothetical protein
LIQQQRLIGFSYFVAKNFGTWMQFLDDQRNWPVYFDQLLHWNAISAASGHKSILAFKN